MVLACRCFFWLFLSNKRKMFTGKDFLRLTFDGRAGDRVEIARWTRSGAERSTVFVTVSQTPVPYGRRKDSERKLHEFNFQFFSWTKRNIFSSLYMFRSLSILLIAFWYSSGTRKNCSQNGYGWSASLNRSVRKVAVRQYFSQPSRSPVVMNFSWNLLKIEPLISL